MNDSVTARVNDTTPADGTDAYYPSDGEQLKYVVVPIVVLASIMLLSALVYLMVRKRKLDRLRHRLMPLYNFDKAEHESDWETEFLNSMDNPNYTEYYSTTSFMQHR